MFLFPSQSWSSDLCLGLVVRCTHRAPYGPKSAVSPVPCSVCGRTFVPRFTYQTARESDAAAYFCSVACRTGRPPVQQETPKRDCAHCGTTFRPQYALQTIEGPDGRRFVCTEACRTSILQAKAPVTPTARILAVLNQKGGTGKTTTAVSIAAGLADRGRRVLLVDADPQGSVSVSLGIKPNNGIYHVLLKGMDPMAATIEARPRLRVLTSDWTLATAERALSNDADRWRVMARTLAPVSDHFDEIVVDCAGAVSLLNHNALAYARELIVPVSCDYLALVGVKQVLRSVQEVNESLKHPVKVLGVLPTFFDVRNRICKRSVEALRDYFKERVMPSVRITAAIKEAPSLGKTIFEHTPKGRAAEDYRAVVDWIQATTEDGKPLLRTDGAGLALASGR